MKETMHASGEALVVPERVIVAPSVGVFRPFTAAGSDEGELVAEGQPIGVVEGPGTATPVRSPFAGRIVGMLAHPGERLREGQPVAWLRVA
jgi:biotin carboxyl carrier protein